jgi:tRNA(fMet)-specific endonuclease VapC
MPHVYLLDTNIVSYFVRGNYPAVRKRIIRIPASLLAVSAVTEAELRFWVTSRSGSTRIRLGVEDFLSDVSSLPWDSSAAQSYADTRELLKRKGRVLSTADLMIAAHALSLGLTLVTHDSAFSYVDGLKTEDWTVSQS